MLFMKVLKIRERLWLLLLFLVNLFKRTRPEYLKVVSPITLVSIFNFVVAVGIIAKASHFFCSVCTMQARQ